LWNVLQTLHGEPERLRVDHDGATWGDVVDVDAEERNARLTSLLNRRALTVVRATDRDVDAAGDGRGVRRWRERRLEPLRLDVRSRGAGGEDRQRQSIPRHESHQNGGLIGVPRVLSRISPAGRTRVLSAGAGGGDGGG